MPAVSQYRVSRHESETRDLHSMGSEPLTGAACWKRANAKRLCCLYLGVSCGWGRSAHVHVDGAEVLPAGLRSLLPSSSNTNQAGQALTHSFPPPPACIPTFRDFPSSPSWLRRPHWFLLAPDSQLLTSSSPAPPASILLLLLLLGRLLLH